MREICLNGTPDEVADQAGEWRDHGVRQMTIGNIGALQPSLRKGLQSSIPFLQALRQLKKL
jgi:phthiodiolone/phenolphthiodiolone dimycocerosates ketoreductase